MDNVKNYFVMFDRDVSVEGSKKSKGRMVFDSYKSFKNYNKALDFSRDQTYSVLAKSSKLDEAELALVRDKDKPYVVAAYFPYKYEHHSYDGSSDSVPTHEVVRSSESELEGVVESLLKEDAKKIYVGVELKALGGLFGGLL